MARPSLYGPRRPRRPRARWRLAAVLVLILLVPALSGCLTLDELMASRKKAKGPVEPATFRVWFAAKPDALPDEFRHFNITLGAIVQTVDITGKDLNILDMERSTIDLAGLSHHKKASLVATGTADAGLYFGILYNVKAAELGIERVVGNRDGEPVKEVDMQPIVANQAPATVQVDHNLLAGKTTDFYVEYDPSRALVSEGNGQYSYTHGLDGVSVYIDGYKIKHHDFSGKTAREAQKRYYGDVQYGGDGVEGGAPSGPRPSLRMQDAWGADLTTTARVGRLVPRAIGLEEPVTFDVVHQLGRNRLPAETTLDEVVWDFADGTRSLQPTVVKAYDSGGIFDVSMRTRETNGRVSTDFITIFVPYRADEALAVVEETRAGTLVAGAGPLSSISLTSHDVYALDFPNSQAGGRWDLGGYRITATFRPPAAEDEDRFLGLTQMRMNVTSGMLQESVAGRSPLVLETAGVPKDPGRGMTDWVEDEIGIELSLEQGGVAEYDLKVEALYFANLSRGLDHHGQHRHGTWHFMQPYLDHLAYDGSLVRALPQNETEEGDS